MRHKYHTPAFVVGRIVHGEANLIVSLLTKEFGMLQARAQGARKPGAKMSVGLQTLAESDVTLLKGKEGWRLAGVVATTDWASELSKEARERATRVLLLAERLMRGESTDERLYHIFSAYLAALRANAADTHESIESLAALRVLELLGLDAGASFGLPEEYTEEAIARAHTERVALIARINRGITASGL